MRQIPFLVPLLLASAMLAGDYNVEIAKFRAEREKSLVREDGWTTVVGLSWLKEGDNRAGSDPKADVPLPASLPAQAGVLTLHTGHVHFQPAAGVKLPARDLKPDSDILALGTVKFFVIQRGEGTAARFGVRVKDSEAPTRKEFTHLSWYPADPSWRIVAKYVPWEKPHVLSFETVVAGLQEQDTSPGRVSFTHEGKEYTLEPASDGSIVFRDQTTGHATYGAGRFLDIDLPKNLKAAASVILDFNEAYNPPCVYTAYATCPLPPPQNRLPVAVTAGELMYNGHH
jgi:uncharacterized protein (DUF1684 family)